MLVSRLRSGRLLSSSLVVLVTLAIAPFGALRAQAQSECQKFNETGNTVCGSFLAYWKGHGGLAQQGFPISEQIQETSDTDGKIYTVQYFERAVFEYHPENAGKPSEVLLQLLGNFLGKQKYPNGAPNAVPNNEPGSRLFTETGQRLGGVFLDYWTKNGGLAQQGFPISNEFTEKNDLDGKDYKVQYFERAVFEYHPENADPYKVLLSQLGTFRKGAKYGNVVQQWSGIGNQDVKMPLKAGLAVFQSVRADNGGYYYIDVVDGAGAHIHTIASGTGPRDLSDAVNLPADGTYTLNVQADNGWTVNVSQPKQAYSPPPAQQTWHAKLSQATPLFSLKSGAATFHIKGTGGKEAFLARLLDQDGKYVQELISITGEGENTITVQIPADGVFIVVVYYDGEWGGEVTQ